MRLHVPYEVLGSVVKLRTVSAAVWRGMALLRMARRLRGAR